MKEAGFVNISLICEQLINVTVNRLPGSVSYISMTVQPQLHYRTQQQRPPQQVITSGLGRRSTERRGASGKGLSRPQGWRGKRVSKDSSSA